jgi:hypothetical protein
MVPLEGKGAGGSVNQKRSFDFSSARLGVDQGFACGLPLRSPAKRLKFILVPLEKSRAGGGVMAPKKLKKCDTGPRLIIICGLPGSGKTTLAKRLETKLHAVRFSPDEWLEALALDLYDEERRGRIESLQWKLTQELLSLGLRVIIE